MGRGLLVGHRALFGWTPNFSHFVSSHNCMHIFLEFIKSLLINYKSINGHPDKLIFISIKDLKEAKKVQDVFVRLATEL